MASLRFQKGAEQQFIDEEGETKEIIVQENINILHLFGRTEEVNSKL